MNKIRKEYAFPSLEQIKSAFREYIKQTVVVDAVVISGNGEPTLHSDFDEAMKLIVDLRDQHLPGKKIIVLTNGAHLDSKRIITGLNLIDERVIKLDAGSDLLIKKINSPLIRMNMGKFLSQLRKLKDCTTQSLFIQGVADNTTNDSIEDWIEVLGMIKPKSVQICTLTRPAPNSELKAVDEDTLYSIAFKLKKRTGLEAEVFAAQRSR